MIESYFLVFLKIHAATILLLMPTILYADSIGLAWVRGVTPVVSKRELAFVHRVVFVGLTLMVLSGALMAYPYLGFLLSERSFLLKMPFVLALIVNGIFIERSLEVAALRPYASLTDAEKRKLHVFGAISSISWLTAIACGFFIHL